ncbi:hypothetical protein KAFR_0B01620 [Kazachstania africana CBS 2517]|uniref:Rho-GAP domain-containing protein n=1 Tax=Kazachstania africana (strain ATCC 22294 / BCRC 22015 / CBS 2517 / CECT 1963 / NBRC 1671 / NRRL Y-8276) TaxID=1071382 RepID=H2AQ11_KAZAF|nr:hypothetical protein KAFR_0B01620 [Kazachstania africana CBS 2517]CCF56461.1 hypothetical protein KAFR_0B01620 [Kazachstania africana CBS 2517]
MSDIRYSLRNIYWSKDYITGIKAFLTRVASENKLVHDKIEFYTDYLAKCWRPFISHLEALEHDHEVPVALKNLVTGYNGLKIEKTINEQCIEVLQVIYRDNWKMHHELNEELMQLFDAYANDFKLTKEAFIECENRANLPSKTKIKNESGDETVEETNVEPSIVPLFANVTFPFVLDDKLNFKNEKELFDFSVALKEKTLTERSIVPIPKLTNEFFKAENIINAIKKIEPRINSSPFNVNHIGQQLLILGLISEYSLYSSNPKSFDINKYYYWNNGILAEKVDSPDKSKTSNALKSENSIQSSISSWIRKVSGTTLDDNSEAEKLSFEFTEWRKTFVKRFNRLEYSEAQLENIFFHSCNKYENISLETNKIVNETNRVFKRLIENTQGHSASEDTIENEKTLENINYSMGFFCRGNTVPFTKWSNSLTSSQQKFMFGTSEIDSDISNSVRLLLCTIEGYEKEEIYKNWASNVSFIRPNNLKREILTEFINDNIDSNSLALQATVSKYSNTTKFVAKDWVDLMKLWLTELPDSLIPSILFDTIKKNRDLNDFEWVDKIPLGNLQVLLEISCHFKRLGNEGGDIKCLFWENGDIPFYHYFVRNPTSKKDYEDDILKLTPVIHRFLTSSKIEAKLAKKKTEKLTEKVNILVEKAEPMGLADAKEIKRSNSFSIPLLQTSQNGEDEEFLPLPFKTSSAMASPKGKRRSGINLLTNSPLEKQED